MPQIGTFARDEAGFGGHLTTLMMAQDVLIVAADPSETENAPQYRVHIVDGETGEPGAEIGAAWKPPASTRANTSRWSSTIRRCRSRSAPICSVTTTRATPGRCTGAASPSTTERSDAMRRAALLLLSGLTFACVSADMAFAQAPGVVRVSARDPFGAHIVEAAQRFQLPAAWIRAILTAESNGNPRAVSPKGAMGLMQLMPATWHDLRLQHRLGSDPFDPHDNIIAGAAYIRLLHDRYGSPGWIAAYNAGPGRYEASLNGRALPPETQRYVAAVAPNLSVGKDPGVTLVAALDPQAWTRSALFVVQGSSNAAADPAPEKRSLTDAPATPTVRDISAIVPQSNGLFVARLGRGMAQ